MINFNRICLIKVQNGLNLLHFINQSWRIHIFLSVLYNILPKIKFCSYSRYFVYFPCKWIECLNVYRILEKAISETIVKNDNHMGTVNLLEELHKSVSQREQWSTSWSALTSAQKSTPACVIAQEPKKFYCLEENKSCKWPYVLRTCSQDL